MMNNWGFFTGGIIGLGEAEEDRVGLLQTLATLPTHPESVPINALIAVKGTPLQEQKVNLIIYWLTYLTTTMWEKKTTHYFNNYWDMLSMELNL